MEFDCDILVVGGGAAGTFAAWGTGGKGLRVTVLDFGNDFDGGPIAAESLSVLRRQEAAKSAMIGRNLDALDRLFLRRPLTPKLAGPLMRFATKDAGDWDKAPDEFRAIQSLAKGGLANVWGAQVYRFGARELRSFPLEVSDIAPYYDRVAQEIGISGSATDDLADFHGAEPMLQPPVVSSRIAGRLLDRYTVKRAHFQQCGIRIGKPRLAVLTRPYHGRPPLRYDNLEFIAPRNNAYYSPHLTLDKMVRDGAVKYIPRKRIVSCSENDAGVSVDAVDVDTDEHFRVRARKLIVCLGAINTARFVLQSYRDYESRLPLLETPMTFTPLVDFAGIGDVAAERTYSSDLSIVVEDPRYAVPLVGMIYNLDGLMRSGLLFDLPLPAALALQMIRAISPAMLALQLYYPQEPSSANQLWIDREGEIRFSYHLEHDFAVEKRVLRLLRRIGFWSAARLSKLALPGDSIHYGGALPMRSRPKGAYETDPFGQLNVSRHTYIGDSAAFPYLPAKNLTYTIMANACRIGEHVANQLRSGDAR